MCAGASAQNGAVGYTYDAVGNRTTLSSSVPAIPAMPAGSVTYDADDRLSTEGYDANGNVTQANTLANSYDFENRMIGRGAMAIVYDGDGNRVQETAGGVTTEYLVDTLNPTGYAQVMDELQPTGVGGAFLVSRHYTWGLQLVSESQTLNNGTATRRWAGRAQSGSLRLRSE